MENNPEFFFQPKLLLLIQETKTYFFISPIEPNDISRKRRIKDLFETDPEMR